MERKRLLVSLTPFLLLALVPFSMAIMTNHTKHDSHQYFTIKKMIVSAMTWPNNGTWGIAGSGSTARYSLYLSYPERIFASMVEFCLPDLQNTDFSPFVGDTWLLSNTTYSCNNTLANASLLNAGVYFAQSHNSTTNDPWRFFDAHVLAYMQGVNDSSIWKWVVLASETGPYSGGDWVQGRQNVCDTMHPLIEPRGMYWSVHREKCLRSVIVSVTTFTNISTTCAGNLELLMSWNPPNGSFSPVVDYNVGTLRMHSLFDEANRLCRNKYRSHTFLEMPLPYSNDTNMCVTENGLTNIAINLKPGMIDAWSVKSAFVLGKPNAANITVLAIDEDRTVDTVKLMWAGQRRTNITLIQNTYEPFIDWYSYL